MPSLDDTGLTTESIEAPRPALAYRVQLAKPAKEEVHPASQQELDLQEQKQNIEDRRTWASRIYRIVLIWLLAVIALVAFQGFHFFGFHLSDSVLITFVSTTTINVLAFGYRVVNYLFPKPT